MKDTMKRTLTFGEELANVVTHGVSALGVLIIMPIIYILIYKDILADVGHYRDLVGVTIFLICIFLMFLMSTLYHTMSPNSTHKLVMRKMDHIFIYVAIAGTYTPIALSILWEIPGYGKVVSLLIMSIQWILVIAGILFKSTAKKGKLNTSVPIYLIMGWIIVIVFPVFFKYAEPGLFWWLLIGGIMYSIGAAFLSMKTKYMHMIWHFFVTFGAVSHIIGICFYLR